MVIHTRFNKNKHQMQQTFNKYKSQQIQKSIKYKSQQVQSQQIWQSIIKSIQPVLVIMIVTMTMIMIMMVLFFAIFIRIRRVRFTDFLFKVRMTRPRTMAVRVRNLTNKFRTLIIQVATRASSFD
jgi:predicted PurR-regulated permease PerM